MLLTYLQTPNCGKCRGKSVMITLLCDVKQRKENLNVLLYF